MVSRDDLVLMGIDEKYSTSAPDYIQIGSKVRHQPIWLSIPHGSKQPLNESKNEFGAEYDEHIHDNKDYFNDSKSLSEPLFHYASAEPLGELGHYSSENVNAYLKNLAWNKSHIVHGHHWTDVHGGVQSISSEFHPERMNKRTIDVFHGIDRSTGENLDKFSSSKFVCAPFISASTSTKVSENFAFKKSQGGDVHILHISAMPGTCISMAHRSAYPENEVLIHHGCVLGHNGMESFNVGNKHLHIHKVVVYNKKVPLDSYPSRYSEM
jgi:hypothetical protein